MLCMQLKISASSLPHSTPLNMHVICNVCMCVSSSPLPLLPTPLFNVCQCLRRFLDSIVPPVCQFALKKLGQAYCQTGLVQSMLSYLTALLDVSHPLLVLLSLMKVDMIETHVLQDAKSVHALGCKQGNLLQELRKVFKRFWHGGLCQLIGRSIS